MEDQLNLRQLLMWTSMHDNAIRIKWINDESGKHIGFEFDVVKSNWMTVGKWVLEEIGSHTAQIVGDGRKFGGFPTMKIQVREAI